MKIQTNLGCLVFKAVLGLVMVAPVFSSCAGLDEMRDRLDEVEARLDSLEISLNDQIQAFDDFLKGQATISECKKNTDGSHTITLSSGAKFTVYPKSASYNTLLTFVEEDGVKYWAMYDAIGNTVVLKDANDKKIPVEAELPVVEEVEGQFILKIGGKEYVTGYSTEDIVTIFTGYELHKDDSDNVYAVTFTFGDGLTFTVPVADYKGFSFHMLGDVNMRVIKDFYVGYGETSRLLVGTEGVIDFVMQVPDGWRVKEVVNEKVGETYLDITAPTLSAIASDAAVDNGELKVVAVTEGGKSMVAKLTLSTEPFKTFTANSSNAVISKYNGVDKVIYGLTQFANFKKDNILAGAEAMLKENGNGVSDKDVDVALATLLGSELKVGERYVLWAIPVFYKSEGEDAGYYFKEDMIYTHEFGAITATVTVNEEDILFNDVKVTVKLAGFSSYYGGTADMSENLFSNIIYQINNSEIEPYTEPLFYEGSAFKFPNAIATDGIEIVSENTYVTWIVPVIEGKSTYAVEDIVYQKYTLPGVTAGGTVTITPGNAVIGKVNIDVPLTAEGGTRIYYAWLTKRAASRMTKDEDRAAYLLKNAEIVDGSSAVAKVDRLDPETDVVLFAMATDAKGKYGPVSVTNYTTDELVNNDLKVTVTRSQVGQDKATLTVSVKGGTATEYLYWAGQVTEEFWTMHEGANVIEKVSAAGEYMALYPDDSDIARAMSKYTLVDGVLTMKGLQGGKDHVVVVIAKDASGNYSLAGYDTFTTMTVNLGEIVKTTDALWTSTKSQISVVFKPERYGTDPSGESKIYAFDITTPSAYTAFILCASEGYFEGLPTVEEQIVEIKTKSSRSYEPGRTPMGDDGHLLCEPDWTDDNGEVHPGSYMNVAVYYTHGYPTNGFATYFAAGSHVEANCDAWENGECSTYARQAKAIESHCTLDYWKDYVTRTRGSYCKKPEVQEKVAKDLYDAYLPYYEDATPLIYVNNANEPLYMEHHYGLGKDDDGNVQDVVYVVLKDAAGNYFEPMKFPVEDHFK